MSPPPRIRSLRSTALAVLVSILVFALMPTSGNGLYLSLVLGLVTVAFVVPITIRRLRAVRVSENPVADAAAAIVLLVLLLVLGFSSAYLALSRAEGQFVDLRTKIDAVYFTVVTLATVGFGDTHPTGQAARLIVTLQILFDVTLIAVAFRLFSRAAQERAEEVGLPLSLRRRRDTDDA